MINGVFFLGLNVHMAGFPFVVNVISIMLTRHFFYIIIFSLQIIFSNFQSKSLNAHVISVNN